MIKTKNKKAGERYLSFWMFLIWIIIIIGIVWGVAMFYSVKIDVRNIESETLAVRIINCLGEDFDYSQTISKSFSIYDKCNFNEQVLNSAIYYFSINIGENGKNLYSIIGGNEDFKVQCEYQELKSKTESTLAICARKSALFTDTKTNKVYSIDVLTASNQVA